jgi:hypothetical protein
MAKRARMRFPQPLSTLLQNELKGLGLADRLREADIWRLWPEVVGPAISSRARPLRIINGTLTVAVSSGPWMQELTFLKGMIREKLNDRMGGEIVKDIVIKSGKVEKDVLTVVDEPSRKKRLTARQLALIDEQSATIADPETREAFIALMKASLENAP